MRSRTIRAGGDWMLAAVVGVALVLSISTVPPSLAAECDAPTTGLVPLTDLEKASFGGEQGGLYPEGENRIPLEHLSVGMEAAESIVPRDTSGIPDPVNGRIVLVSIGVSNTRLEFQAFMEEAQASTAVNPRLTFVNGAQFGRALGQWASRRATTTWDTVDQNLAGAGVTPGQVQAAWIKIPSRSRGPASLQEARDSVQHVASALQIARERYPNLAIAYLSSRTYGGYIPDSNSEPNAYLHGFEVKFVIEAQIEGTPALNTDPADESQRVPWIAWGPYLWADGVDPRTDGLSWECSDFREDGVHPSESGQRKVASLLFDHFSSDPTSTPWFSGEPAAPETTEAQDQSPPAETTLPRGETTVPRAGDPAGDERERLNSQDRPRIRPGGTRGPSATSQRMEEIPDHWGQFAGGVALGLVAGGGVIVWSRRRQL